MGSPQHVSLYLASAGMAQSDDGRTLVAAKTLPVPHPTKALTGCQSAHLASEHFEQQAPTKSASLAEAAVAAPLWRSKK